MHVVIMIESCDTNNNKRRWRDSSTSGIGQRWYRCTERDLGAHIHMHMGMCAALVTIIIIGTSGMVVIIIGARRVIAPGISIDSMRAVTLMVMYRFVLTLITTL